MLLQAGAKPPAAAAALVVAAEEGAVVVAAEEGFLVVLVVLVVLAVEEAEEGFLVGEEQVAAVGEAGTTNCLAVQARLLRAHRLRSIAGAVRWPTTCLEQHPPSRAWNRPASSAALILACVFVAHARGCSHAHRRL